MWCNSAGTRRSAAYARVNIGLVLSLQGEAVAARAQFAQALAVFQSLAAADPRDAQYRFDVIDALGLAANSAIDMGDTAWAIAQLPKTLDLLAAMPANAEQAASLSTNQFRMGKAYLHAALARQPGDAAARREFVQARGWYQRSLPGLTRAREQRILQGREVRMVEDAQSGIEKCDRALGGAR